MRDSEEPREQEQEEEEQEEVRYDSLRPPDPTVKGTNPQNLVEKILRNRIFENAYWKAECFGLTSASLVDKALELTEIGGTYGALRKPTRFIMLTLRMLQIQPEHDIVVEFIRNEEYRYVRLLGAFYLRLVGQPADVFQFLEPLYNDFRRIVVFAPEGKSISHVDEFVWTLLHSDFACDISLPRIPKRCVLENLGLLERRVSALEDDPEPVAPEPVAPTATAEVAAAAPESKGEKMEENAPAKSSADDRKRERSRSRSKSRDRGDHHHHRHHHYHHEERGRDRDHDHRSHRDRDQRSEKRAPDVAPAAAAAPATTDDTDPEVATMNALRASLGLKPLK